MLDYRGPSNSILCTRSSYDLLTSRVIYRQAETSAVSLKEQFKAEQSFVQDKCFNDFFHLSPSFGMFGDRNCVLSGPSDQRLAP